VRESRFKELTMRHALKMAVARRTLDFVIQSTLLAYR
jgi:hypothetical protein